MKNWTLLLAIVSGVFICLPKDSLADSAPAPYLSGPLGPSHEQSTRHFTPVMAAARSAILVGTMRARHYVAGAKAGTNWSGGWHGRLVRRSSTCAGFPSSFLFRHRIALSGNRVAIATSHDGILRGLTRDAGRRVDANRNYYSNRTPISVAVVYRNMNRSSSTASLGFGVGVTTPSGDCVAGYGAVAIRAFY